jgi:mannitol-1-phosphate/altronate dehydrogenase
MLKPFLLLGINNYKTVMSNSNVLKGSIISFLTLTAAALLPLAANAATLTVTSNSTDAGYDCDSQERRSSRFAYKY